MRKLIGALKWWTSRRVGIEVVVEINWFKSANDILYACPESTVYVWLSQPPPDYFQIAHTSVFPHEGSGVDAWLRAAPFPFNITTPAHQ